MENEEKVFKLKRDRKLFFKAFFCWWNICFIILVFVVFLFVSKDYNFILRCLKSIGIAFVGAFPVNSILYFVIFPILSRKSMKSGRRVTEIIHEGLTSENVAELEYLLEICSPYDTHSSTTIITSLAEHYLFCGELEKAERCLNKFNIYFYNSISNCNSSKLAISFYYQLKIRLENQKNGRDAANAAYALAESYFNKFYGENELINCLIDSGTAEYDYANGRYDEAIQRIMPYVEFKEVKCETYASLARYSAAAGNREQAMQYLQLAEKYIKNATDKAQIEYLKRIIL